MHHDPRQDQTSQWALGQAPGHRLTAWCRIQSTIIHRITRLTSWLVVWNMTLMTFYISGMSSSQMTFICFRGIGFNHQPDLFVVSFGNGHQGGQLKWWSSRFGQTCNDVQWRAMTCIWTLKPPSRSHRNFKMSCLFCHEDSMPFQTFGHWNRTWINHSVNWIQARNMWENCIGYRTH